VSTAERAAAIAAGKTVIELQNEAVTELWVDADLASEKDGEQTFDPNKLTAKSYEVALAAKVARPEDKHAKALSKGRFLSLVLPNVPAPGSEAWNGGDEIDQYAWEKVRQTAWRGVSDGRSTRVQRKLRMRNLTLCRTTVDVDGNEADAIYVTANEDLLLADYFGPRRSKHRVQVENFQADVEALMSAHPELADVFAKHAQRAIGNAAASAKKALAELASPDSDEEEKAA
jgi:hypothetical protein